MMVPPPPPNTGLSSLSLNELPPPPAKPSLARKLKLSAIVGDKAILTFADKELARENHWPLFITLGMGDQFESLSVVQVDAHSVVLDEDGERSTKNLSPVR
jgi:hypothetical protein